MDTTFWHNKKVLVTGHTGFKGRWLSLWLQQLGAKVSGYSLAPATQPSLFEQANVSDSMNSIIGDIRDLARLQEVFSKVQPEIVFHMAAQALVRESYSDPITTYSTNVMGSLNVLEAIRNTSCVRSVVIVSTDKCYDNKEWPWGYRERDPLGGYDPYSASKSCMEIMIASYRSSYFTAEKYAVHGTAIATARAGNVIGGGDWTADRLVPDIIDHIHRKQDITLRYPHSVRPWQHVLEPLSGYMRLAELLFSEGCQYAQSWNFGPEENATKSVKWIADYLLRKSSSDINIIVENQEQAHEAAYLKLDCSKAAMALDWRPVWSLPEALNKVLSWVPSHESSASDLCFKQIAEFSCTEENIQCK
jgi:CDP-glucose 4,6-dehydratase